MSQAGELIVDDFQDLLSIIDNKENKFIVENEAIIKVIIDAKQMIERVDAPIAKIGIKDMLFAAGVVGAAVLLTITGLWPIALLPLLEGGYSTGSIEKDAYAKLVVSLGETRVDYLLNNYRFEQNIFCIGS